VLISAILSQAKYTISNKPKDKLRQIDNEQCDSHTNPCTADISTNQDWIGLDSDLANFVRIMTVCTHNAAWL